MQMFYGRMGGSMGEVAAAALIIGAFISSGKRSSPGISRLDTGNGRSFYRHTLAGRSGKFADPLFHLLTGGLILGAIYMATDYVTSPMTHKGMIIYGIGIGVITVFIRTWGAYPEGVSFAVLIMNAFVRCLICISTAQVREGGKAWLKCSRP